MPFTSTDDAIKNSEYYAQFRTEERDRIRQQILRQRNLRRVGGAVSAGPSARGRSSSTQIYRGYKKQYAIGGREGYKTVRTGRGNHHQIITKSGSSYDRGQRGLKGRRRR